MDYRKKFIVKPGSSVELAKNDPSYSGKHKSHKKAASDIDKQIARMDRLQYLLYADANKSRPGRMASSGIYSPAWTRKG
jgi:hypothetical protein